VGGIEIHVLAPASTLRRLGDCSTPYLKKWSIIS
jgi:hypothetical protein